LAKTTKPHRGLSVCIACRTSAADCGEYRKLPDLLEKAYDCRLDLWVAIPIKRACRCVSVPAQGWGLSSRVCPLLLRHLLPGPGWLHEFEHDGIRILARRDGAGVRLITRHGNDFAARFPLVASAVAALPARSCVIDGEAVVCDENGLVVFELIRGHDSKTSAVLCAFDLLELDGRDLRRRPVPVD